MSAKDFEIISSLGKGSYSSVYKVKRVADGLYYAMKKVSFGKLTDKEKENALNEVRLIASINSPYIISYKEAFFDNYTLCIIMEYAEGGDLLHKIELYKKGSAHFSEDQVWKMFFQIAKGLKALHDLNIVHRDLKCANVFLTKEGDAKLGDFNVSKIAKKGLLCTQTGTPYYASPEVWRDKPYNSKSDIWSLGVVAYEVCTFRPPFMANSMSDLYKKIMKGEYPPLPPLYSKDIGSAIKLCLQLNPESRPTSTFIVKMEKSRKMLMETQRGNMPLSHDLLSTIKLDKNIKVLQKNLPRPCYSQPNSNAKLKIQKNLIAQKQESVSKQANLNSEQSENKNQIKSTSKQAPPNPIKPPLTERCAPPKVNPVYIRKAPKVLDQNAKIEKPISSAPQSACNKYVPKPPPTRPEGQYVSNPKSQRYLCKNPSKVPIKETPRREERNKDKAKHNKCVKGKANKEQIVQSSNKENNSKNSALLKNREKSNEQAVQRQKSAPRAQSNLRPYSVMPSWWG